MDVRGSIGYGCGGTRKAAEHSSLVVVVELVNPNLY